MQNIKSSLRIQLQNLLCKNFFSILIAVAAISINSCSSGPGDPGAASTETTTIYGHITDESGTSLSGVTVTGGVKPVTTDENGMFILKDVTIPKGRAVIVAKKDGYFNAARAE